MGINRLLIFLLLFPLMIAATPTPPASSQEPVVHAVLFYSPGCGHCYKVITEDLPPLFEKYSEQLSMVGVDVTQPGGQTLFWDVLQYFEQESGPVPFLVVGNTYLIGSADIPQKFPGLIEQYLAQGGVDWPPVPGLAEAMQPPRSTATSAQFEGNSTGEAVTNATPPAQVEAETTPNPGILVTSNQNYGLKATFTRDPLGNTLALIVLISMIFSLGGAVIFLRQTPNPGPSSTAPDRWGSWLIPLLCLIGLGVAGYLAYVETTQVQAVCGPVGDCNTVQQSKYAILFNVLPVGILGIAGYVMIFLSWVVGRYAGGRIRLYAYLTLFGLTAFGLLFSIYLTFLEPFIIGATCAWCLASAILMTALFWLSLAPVKLALSVVLTREKHAAKRKKVERRL